MTIDTSNLSGGKAVPAATATAFGLLSEREIEVLRLVGQDRSSKQVAFRLGISERTVHQHLANIYAKLAVSSRLGAVLRALEIGLLTLEDCRTKR